MDSSPCRDVTPEKGNDEGSDGAQVPRCSAHLGRPCRSLVVSTAERDLLPEDDHFESIKTIKWAGKDPSSNCVRFLLLGFVSGRWRDGSTCTRSARQQRSTPATTSPEARASSESEIPRGPAQPTRAPAESAAVRAREREGAAVNSIENPAREAKTRTRWAQSAALPKQLSHRKEKSETETSRIERLDPSRPRSGAAFFTTLGLGWESVFSRSHQEPGCRSRSVEKLVSVGSRRLIGPARAGRRIAVRLGEQDTCFAHSNTFGLVACLCLTRASGAPPNSSCFELHLPRAALFQQISLVTSAVDCKIFSRALWTAYRLSLCFLVHRNSPQDV